MQKGGGDKFVRVFDIDVCFVACVQGLVQDALQYYGLAIVPG
jgi:hypothetical protein